MKKSCLYIQLFSGEGKKCKEASKKMVGLKSNMANAGEVYKNKSLTRDGDLWYGSIYYVNLVSE